MNDNLPTQLYATVVGGLLKPDNDLHLAEETRVRLTLVTVEEDTDALAAWESLKARLRKRPIHSGGERLSREELHERH